jgi:hypothetical protein
MAKCNYYQDTVIKVAYAEIPAGNKNMEIWGSNDGPKVKEYLKSVNINTPAPWCAAFVYWCINQVANPNPFLQNGYCPTIETWAKEHNILSDIPERGDAFLLCDDIGPFHIGFVSIVKGNGEIVTVEGNTNLQGSPEGIGVFERTRNVSDCKFIKWYKLIDITELDIVLKDKVISCGKVINNKTYVPARAISITTGAKIDWQNKTQTLVINNTRMHDVIFIDNTAYVYIREFASACKFAINFNAKDKKITLHTM